MCKGVNKGDIGILENIGDRKKIRVDKCLVPLLRELNKFGFKTVGSSCCGHGHIGHLQLEFGKKINNVLVTKDTISIEFKG